ncbi:MAG: hypothetical protein ACT4QA_14645 [Panacagrimonas sp.]
MTLTYVTLTAVALGVTLLAVCIKSSWVRLAAIVILFALFATSLLFSFESIARRLLETAVQEGFYSEDFGDGVRGLLSMITGERILLFSCGFGLLVLSLSASQRNAQ